MAFCNQILWILAVSNIFGCVLVNGRSLSSSSLQVIVNGDSATIVLDISGPGLLECSLDDGEVQTCSPGDTFTDLSPGRHTITVVFSGPSTKFQSSTSFIIEDSILPEPPTAPSTSTTSDLRVFVSEDTATILLGTSGPRSLECSLDGGEFQPCSPGDTFTDLPAGDHTITVLFTGPSTTIQSSASFTIEDSITSIEASGLPPVSPPAFPRATSHLQVVVNGDTATILLDTGGPGSLECSLDGGEFQTCSSGDTFTDLPAGLHFITAMFTGPSTRLQSSTTFTVNSGQANN